MKDNKEKDLKIWKEKLENIEEDYTCIEYNAVCREGLIRKINAIENITRNLLKAQKEELLDTLLEKGQGGGNWRRLIIQLKEFKKDG